MELSSEDALLQEGEATVTLKPGLVDQQTRLKLWKKASRKTAYLVGFAAFDRLR